MEEDIDIQDVSLLKNYEPGEIAAFKSIINSFINNIAITLTRIIMAINLIILGYNIYDDKRHCDKFIVFQIGIMIIEIFGKFFILGLIKYLFESKRETTEFYVLYLRMKSALVILIPIFLGIICLIVTFLLMKLLSIFNPDICNYILNKELFFSFLIFAPFIYLFELLFLLNIQFMQYQKVIKRIIIFVITFLLSHFSLGILLVYLLDLGLFGLSIVYCLNSFIFYSFTNRSINNSCEELTQVNFFLIPNKANFDGEIFKLLKEKSILSIKNISEIFFLYYLFFLSIFTDRTQLIVNIIYINFYELITFINKGFYLSLKNYISTYNANIRRQKFVIYFTIYYSVLLLILFLVLIIFDNFLLEIYFGREEKSLAKICYDLRIIFPICVLLNGITMILNGIIRGMGVYSPTDVKIGFVIIGMIISSSLCFIVNGILGLWIGVCILNICFILLNVHEAKKNFPQFFLR